MEGLGLCSKCGKRTNPMWDKGKVNKYTRFHNDGTPCIYIYHGFCQCIVDDEYPELFCEECK